MAYNAPGVITVIMNVFSWNLEQLCELSGPDTIHSVSEHSDAFWTQDPEDFTSSSPPIPTVV